MANRVIPMIAFTWFPTIYTYFDVVLKHSRFRLTNQETKTQQ